MKNTITVTMTREQAEFIRLALREAAVSYSREADRASSSTVGSYDMNAATIRLYTEKMKDARSLAHFLKGAQDGRRTRLTTDLARIATEAA